MYASEDWYFQFCSLNSNDHLNGNINKLIDLVAQSIITPQSKRNESITEVSKASDRAS